MSVATEQGAEAVRPPAGVATYAVRAEDVADLIELLETVVQDAAGPQATWLASVEGGRDELRYVAEIAGVAVGGRLRRARPPEPTVFELVGRQAVSCVLAAGVQRGHLLTLLLVPDGDRGRAEAALREGRGGEALNLCEVGVVHRAGTAEAVIALAEGVPLPPCLSAMGARRRARLAPVPPSPPPSSTPRAGAAWRRGGAPRARLAVAVAVGLTATAGVVATSMGRSTGTRAPGPAVRAPLVAPASAGHIGPVPPPGMLVGLAFDPVDEQLVLVGGVGGSAAAETWTYTAADGWRDDTAASGRLPAGGGPSLAWDPGSQSVLLVMGGQGDGSPAETWARPAHGGAWRQLHPSAGLACPVGMVTDPLSHAPLLFTACLAGTHAVAVDTWAWRQGDWVEVGGGRQPLTGRLTRMTVDPVTGRALALVHPPGEADVFSTWIWDGGGWNLVDAAGPPVSERPVLAADWVDGTSVLYGGMSAPGASLTWTWDGREWRPHRPAAARTPALAAAAASDGQGRILLLGGSSPSGDIGETWTWTGDRWQQLG